MIVVVMRGGLGNQMFQYAAGRALSARSGTPLLLDATLLQDRFPRKDITRYALDLDIFEIMPRFTALSRIARAVPVPGLWLALDLGVMKIRDALGMRKIWREKDYADDPRAFESQNDATLWDYWQSEKYFTDIKDKIQSEFRFREPLAGEAAGIGEAVRRENSVSLHVRRGDYILPKYAKLYGGTDLAYYGRAIAHVAERVKNPRFFIFSNDAAWCRENIKSPFPMVYVPAGAAGPKASFHLQLMSLCKHNIIANSTFSWWGAWLNANAGKIVVAPKQWYRDSNMPAAGIVPAGWTKL